MSNKSGAHSLLNKPIPDPLMRPFVVVVLDVLPHEMVEMLLPGS